MCIFVGHLEFLNFDVGGWAVQIRNQQRHKLSITEFHPNQITFGIVIRHIRSGGPSCPRGPSCSTYPYYMYKIFNEFVERQPNTTKTFIQTCDSLIN